jgi:hypothetical protein
MPLPGGLIGALGSIGSSLLSNRGAKKRQQQADKQNIKFWQMQNAYNTPKMQMQRLQDAGLNPALIYGSGSANTGVAGSVAPSKPAPFNVKDPTPSAVQSMLSAAQIGLITSQAAKNRAETKQTLALTGPRTWKLQAEANIKKIEESYTDKKKQAELKTLQQKALQAAITTGVQKKQAEYEKDLLDMNINPKTSAATAIIQAMMKTVKDAIEFFFKGTQTPQDNPIFPAGGQ